jgi:hypothetical protein
MAEHWEVPKEDAEPKRANTGTGFWQIQGNSGSWQKFAAA